MICPNCGKPTVILTNIDPMENYYNSQAPRNRCKCKLCHASFINYDNGQEERENIEKTERQERETLKRLVKKYGIDKNVLASYREGSGKD